MNDFEALHKKLNINIKAEYLKLIQKHEDKILSILQSQLYSGEGGLGKLQPDYTNFTKKRKKEKGQPTDRVTHKDTGAYYNSMKIFEDKLEADRKENGLDIAKHLWNKYKGSNQLNDENIKFVVKMLNDEFITILNEKLR